MYNHLTVYKQSIDSEKSYSYSIVIIEHVLLGAKNELWLI